MHMAIQIQAARLQRGRSVGELEAEARIEKGVLAQIEQGAKVPSRAMLERLAMALGMAVCELLAGRGGALCTPWLTSRLTLQQLARDESPVRQRSGHAEEVALILRFRERAGLAR